MSSIIKWSGPSVRPCLSSAELAERWRMSDATLRNWRWSGVGCPFVKLGGRVVYRLTDVERFEQEHLTKSTSSSGIDRR